MYQYTSRELDSVSFFFFYYYKGDNCELASVGMKWEKRATYTLRRQHGLLL